MVGPQFLLTVHILPLETEHSMLGLGCWSFGGTQWGGQEDADSLSAMEAALRCGITHFDTAAGYGRGRSEQVVGRFLLGRRDQVFLATKGSTADLTRQAMRKLVDQSLERLGTDVIDLYYVHWPRSGKDLRPWMEGLEEARARGQIRAIGVSNFSVAQMEQVSEVGTVDAHQLCYNLIWRFAERELIPYCRERGIAVVTYSSIAQGILTGKFPRKPQFREGDQRPQTVPFDPQVWPYVYEGVQALKALAQEVGRPLVHLAIPWLARRPGVTSVLVGARNGTQVEENAAAMMRRPGIPEIPDEVYERMTAIGDRVMAHMPDTGNIFRYYP